VGYIQLTGADQTLRALSKIKPETAKEVNRELYVVGKAIATLANSKIPGDPPISGWRTVSPHTWSTGKLTRGGAGWPPWERFSFSGRKGKGMSVFIQMRGALATGMIFETAGINGTTAGRGVRLVNSMPRIARPAKGRAGRGLRAANAERYRQTLEDIEKAVRKAEAAIERMLP
jgi:hypothetical protein